MGDVIIYEKLDGAGGIDAAANSWMDAAGGVVQTAAARGEHL